MRNQDRRMLRVWKLEVFPLLDIARERVDLFAQVRRAERFNKITGCVVAIPFFLLKTLGKGSNKYDGDMCKVWPRLDYIGHLETVTAWHGRSSKDNLRA